MNLIFAIFAGAGVAAWVYSKIMHSSGGNNQSSIIVAGAAGVAAFVIMTIVMNATS